MTSTDERPSIAERYAVATETSDMRVGARSCPADIIIAAAFSGERAGATFQRLRGEFDQAKAEVQREAAGQGIGAANERMLVMLRLRSLKDAKEELRLMACAMASRGGYEFGEDLAHLAWQALSVWLDPTCAPCGGTGVLGGYSGAPQLQCRRCCAGNRRGFAGKSEGERRFVDRLVGEIGDALVEFERKTLAAMR